jgi:FMN-dependent NADH-azoreductase
MKKAIKVSDDLIEELKSADAIGIGTPMYNFSVPAILKAWIDQIVRDWSDVAIPCRELLTGKKATVRFQLLSVTHSARDVRNYPFDELSGSV